MSNSQQQFFSSRLSWILYCVLFLCTMYSERVLFSEAYKDLTDYLIIGGIWLAVFLAAILLGKRLPIKYLTLVIFLGAMVLSFIWLYFSFQLRVYGTTNYHCTTWDCEVKNEIFTYCDSWVCQQLGQSILFVVQFAVILPFLIFWTQKRHAGVSNNLTSSLLIIGILLLVVAGVHYIAYYLAFYLVAVLWIGFALSLIPVLKTSIKTVVPKTESNAPNSPDETAPFRLDLCRMWSNLIILLFTALFGYSLLDGEKIHFELTFAFGIGVCFSAMIWHFMETQQKSLTLTIDRFEVIIFLVILASCVQGLHFFSAEPEVEFIAGMNSSIIGMIFGYIFIRIMAMLDQQYQPIGRLFLPLPRKMQQSLNLIILGIVFLILYVVGMIEIAPQVEAAYITYAAALGVGLLGFFLSITRHRQAATSA